MPRNTKQDHMKGFVFPQRNAILRLVVFRIIYVPTRSIRSIPSLSSFSTFIFNNSLLNWLFFFTIYWSDWKLWCRGLERWLKSFMQAKRCLKLKKRKKLIRKPQWQAKAKSFKKISFCTFPMWLSFRKPFLKVSCLSSFI